MANICELCQKKITMEEAEAGNFHMAKGSRPTHETCYKSKEYALIVILWENGSEGWKGITIPYAQQT